MESLPDELLEYILDFLAHYHDASSEEEDAHHALAEDIRAVVSVGGTNRRLRAVVEAWRSWRRFYVRRFLVWSPFQVHSPYGECMPMTDEDVDRATASSSSSGGGGSDAGAHIDDRWRAWLMRDMRWSSGKHVKPAVAQVPSRVAMTTGLNTVVDVRDPSEPMVYVSCGNGRIHSFKYDRESQRLSRKKGYSLSNVGTRAILGAMRITDSYMTGLLQTDDLIIPYAHGQYKVFRKGSKWAKLAVATGEGYPTLGLNKQLMWLASTTWNCSQITVHDLGSAKEVAKITTTVSHVPGMVTKHDLLVVGGEDGLSLYDLRSGNKERDIIAHQTLDNRNRILHSVQFVQNDESDMFLFTAYDAQSTLVYDWSSLELKRTVPAAGYDMTCNRDMLALATSSGAFVADLHSPRSGHFVSGSGTSEAAYADWRKVVIVSHAVDEEKRILVHDLATGRQRTFAHPGGTDHSLGSAMPNDDLLVTASKNTVAVWDFGSVTSHS